MADLAWRFARQGYDAVASDRRARGGGDDFESRLLGRRAVVVRSREGARAFYDESLVRREHALPPPLAWLLFGRGAVHGLDGPEHHGRKRLFLDVLAPERLMPLVEGVEVALRERVATWPGREVAVHDELVRAYGRAVLTWAGLSPAEVTDARSRQLAAIVDGFGVVGPAYGRAWRARVEANRWASGVVDDVRSGRVVAPAGSVVDAIARSSLSRHTAGVELLNVLRPTVAIAWLGTFAALRFAQLDDLEGWRSRLVDPRGARERFSFAQEVRRTTPFAPALAGKVRRRAEISGVVAQPGDWLVLDIIGIDHDPSRWPDPDRFVPGRFLDADAGAFDLVPQGGGSPTRGHRCPGESVALSVLDVTLSVLPLVDYAVQDPDFDRRRIPTLPRGGLVVRVPATMSKVSA